MKHNKIYIFGGLNIKGYINLNPFEISIGKNFKLFILFI